MMVDDSELDLMILTSKASKSLLGYESKSPIASIKQTTRNIVTPRVMIDDYRKAYPIREACNNIRDIRDTSRANFYDDLL